MIQIKPKPLVVQDTANQCYPCSPDRGMPLIQQPRLRFAVGTFLTWVQIREALRDARARGLVLESFNCLALHRVFAGKTIMAPSQEPVTLQPLPFPDSSELVACTCGPLAECLADRLRSGARTLKGALEHWLIPRHAAHFQGEVEVGRILLWIQIADAHEERLAYQNLLAASSNAVGIHDLLRPGDH